jgi:hypothetical protein
VLEPSDGACLVDVPGERDASERLRSLSCRIVDSRPDLSSRDAVDERLVSESSLPMRRPIPLLDVRLRDGVTSRVALEPVDGVCDLEKPREREARDRRRSVIRCMTDSRAEVVPRDGVDAELRSSSCLPMRFPMLLRDVGVRVVPGVRPESGAVAPDAPGFCLNDHDRLRFKMDRRVVLLEPDEMLDRGARLERDGMLGREEVLGRVIVLRREDDELGRDRLMEILLREFDDGPRLTFGLGRDRIADERLERVLRLKSDPRLNAELRLLKAELRLGLLRPIDGRGVLRREMEGLELLCREIEGRDVLRREIDGREIDDRLDDEGLETDREFELLERLLLRLDLLRDSRASTDEAASNANVRTKAVASARRSFLSATTNIVSLLSPAILLRRAGLPFRPHRRPMTRPRDRAR